MFFEFVLAKTNILCYNSVMNIIRCNAYAKLNLTLDIIGKEDGFHLIDSLVTTIDLSDLIVAKKRKDKFISVIMHGMDSEMISPEENNAQRAGEAFVSAFGTNGATITIYKNIPIGAGLGGSSADAAGVLNALAKLYDVKDENALKALADSLGSDTGFLLKGGVARMTGRGTQIQPIEGLPRLNFLLFCPRQGVSTAACYHEYDNAPSTGSCTERAISYLKNGEIERASKYFQNDLFTAAVRLNDVVQTTRTEAESFSPWATCMTGSGSAVFALFETPELCAWAKSRYRGKCRTIIAKTMAQRKQIRQLYSIEYEEE